MHIEQNGQKSAFRSKRKVRKNCQSQNQPFRSELNFFRSKLKNFCF